MKKLHILIAMTLLVSVNAMAQGWPANYGGVMLQGFFWDSYKEKPDNSPWGPRGDQDNDGTKSHKPGYTWATMYGAGWGSAEEWQVPVTTWPSLLAHKDDITPFIDLLWLPQSGSTVAGPTTTYNGIDDSGRNGVRAWRTGDTWDYNEGDVITNPDCMGFVPVFYFHHGMTFNEDGSPWTYTDSQGKVWTPMSYFGTEAQLRELISTFKNKGTGAIEDVVANHRGGLGTWSGDANSIEFPAEYYKGELIEWTAQDVCRDDESGRGTGDWDCGGDAGKGTWARDIDHHTPATRAKVIKYLDFMKNDLGYVGFRYDYARGFEPKHFAEYNTAIRPTFSVGEFWGSQDEISAWIKGVYNEDGFQSAAFDFPLMNSINDAFNNNNFRALNGAGLINDPKLRRYAVTFVDNHDTFKDLPTDGSNAYYGHRTHNNVLEANAFILAMPGTPCLFWPHFMHPAWHAPICNMIKARRTAGITNESAIWAAEEKGSNGIQWRVTGNNGEVYIQLGDAVSEGVPEGFSEVWASSNARYSIINSLADKWQNNEKQNLLQGYPVIDTRSGNYAMTEDSPLYVTVSPSIENTTLVYTTNGHNPQAGDKTITEATTLTFSETTTLKVGVLVNGTVPVSSVVTREYIAASAQSASKINIYVHDNNAPYVYLWGNSSSITPAEYSSFPGEQMSTKETVGGMEWWKVQVDRPAGEMNMILTWNPYDSSNKSQTPDINGITSDVFYIVNNGVPTNVTNTFLPAIDNPMVSIDKATGTYEGSVTARFTASYSNATIVYTVDGTEPTVSSTQLTSGSTLTFTDDVTLRAGIVKDGEVINQVARSYNIINGEATNGINIYVRVMNSDITPLLYYWNSNTSGDNVKMTETKQYNGQNWYYYKIVNMPFANIILKGDPDNVEDWSQKTSDINGLSSPGNYFYYYYPNGSGDRYEVAPGLYTKLDNDYLRIYINCSNPSEYNLWAWADGFQKFSNWPGSTIQNLDGPITIGDKQWYVCPIKKNYSNKKFKFSKNGSEESSEYDLNTDMFVIYPNYQNVTENYKGYLNESSTSTLPSCITPMHDCYYFYFVDDGGFDSPFAWVWNNTTVYSGSSWPGEALVDVVGTDQNGNLIYRWTYYGDKPEPANVIFSNNGNSQTADLDFVNGGYYNSAGTLLGTVSGNLMTLAEVIRKGTTSETYTISNNLTAVYFDKQSGKRLFAKDGSGDAILKSYNSTGKPVHNAMKNFPDNEQSNWVELVLPEALSSNDDLTQFDNKMLLGQTIVGTLTDATNPTIELIANPIVAGAKAFEPNKYVTANFNTDANSDYYFFVEPKAQEYATIEWAVYHEGKFYMPLNPEASNPNAVNTVHGAVNVSNIETYLNEQPQLANETMYTLKVIVKRKPKPTVQGAPRLMVNGEIDVNTNDPVSDQWEIALVEVTKLDDSIVTPIENVNTHRQLVRTIYFNLNGIESDRPFQGVNIVVKEYSDGTRSASKMIK